MDKFIKGSIAIGGSIASYFFGGWDILIQALVFFIVVDYFTGAMAAAKYGKLSSNVGFNGIKKKVFIFIMVACAVMVDKIFNTDVLIRNATIIAYIINEFESLIENFGRMNVPVPDKIKQAFVQLKDREVNK